ncbi:MAG: NAD(P)-binding domain-containing protein, partial [Pseudomonadota bacterium]|nr:NAD(P)-binding domain-containing protein [Pseudomonadota bacterium]
MTDRDGTLEPPAEVAFVGLGKMGLPMAGRLLAAGYRVTGCDLAEPALRAFAAAGGRTAAHVRDAV